MLSESKTQYINGFFAGVILGATVMTIAALIIIFTVGCK